MSTLLRDPWSDARLVVTEKVLDDDLAAVRRRAWVRQTLVTLLGGATLVAAGLLGDALWDSSLDGPWVPNLLSLHVASGLGILGFVLMLVGGITSARAGAGTFLRPENVLDRSGRTWLRRRIAAGAPVAPEQQEVAVAVARRMAADAAGLPQPVGFLLLCLALTASTPIGGVIVLVALLAGWTVLDAVRTQVRAHQARRWLVRNA